MRARDQTDAGSALLVAQQVMAITAEYIDWVTQRVIGSYSAEREHWLIQRNVLRSRHIRRLLAGKYPENGSLDAAIDFPLRLRHIAVVAWMDDTVAEADAYTQIDRELRRFKEFLPLNGESLLVPADQVTIWAWFPLFSQTTADQVAAAMNSLVETSTKRIFYAVGTIESGGHGFRVSHARAQLVRKVMLAARTGTRVGTFADRGMSVTALWGDDLDRAQDWVSYVLGPLADELRRRAAARDPRGVLDNRLKLWGGRRDPACSPQYRQIPRDQSPGQAWGHDYRRPYRRGPRAGAVPSARRGGADP